MGKKAVKRSVEKPTEADKQSPKKVKLNGNIPKKEPQAPNDAVVKTIIKKKNVKLENGKKIEAVKTDEKKPSETTVVNGEKKEKLKGTPEEIIQKQKEKILAKKTKMLEKKKQELIEKNEKRKLKRQEEGQFKPEQIQKSQAEIEEKIAEIQNRPELTKTARRRLAVLKKKLSILDGSALTKSLAVTPTLTLSEKRKLRRMKSNLTRKAEEGEEEKEGAEKSLKVKKSKPAEKKNNLAQQVKKEKVEQKKQSKDETEEVSMDQDDDENEDTEEEQSDNSSTDIPVEQEEENEEAPKLVVKENKKKQQVVQKTANPENTTPTEKKTRFVLFVGNIPHGYVVYINL